MLLSLIDDTCDGIVDITVEVPDVYASVIRGQIHEIKDTAERARFTKAFLRNLARVIGDFVDSDIRPPTEKQVLFAFSLAKRQGVDIPREALIYRGAMHQFLEERLDESSRGTRKSNNVREPD